MDILECVDSEKTHIRHAFALCFKPEGMTNLFCLFAILATFIAFLEIPVRISLFGPSFVTSVVRKYFPRKFKLSRGLETTASEKEREED